MNIVIILLYAFKFHVFSDSIDGDKEGNFQELNVKLETEYIQKGGGIDLSISLQSTEIPKPDFKDACPYFYLNQIIKV